MVLATIFALLFYLATIVLIAGLVYRAVLYARTPIPLVIPTTPAPIGRAGVAARLFREVVFFESLFKGSKWTWLFGWLFHFGLLLVLARHLRYFTEPVWSWVVMIQWLGVYAGFAMFAGLAGLFGRRLLVDRVRYISTPADFLMLGLLMAIAGSGLLMKYFWHTDIMALKAFALGMLSFSWKPLPADPLLLLHLLLVVALMIVFPFSKLLHGLGLLFSPTRTMPDNPREHRHVAAWARKLETAASAKT